MLHESRSVCSVVGRVGTISPANGVVNCSRWTRGSLDGGRRTDVPDVIAKTPLTSPPSTPEGGDCVWGKTLDSPRPFSVTVSLPFSLPVFHPPRGETTGEERCRGPRSGEPRNRNHRRREPGTASCPASSASTCTATRTWSRTGPSTPMRTSRTSSRPSSRSYPSSTTSVASDTWRS